VIFVPLYFKWPQSMRFLFVLDALDRIINAAIPIQLLILVRFVPLAVTVDILCNYCADFWASFSILQVSILLIYILSGVCAR